MHLTDVVSHAGLHGYAEIAMILFFLAFLTIVLRVMAPSRKREMDRMARLPLDDDEHPSPGAHR